MSSIDTRVVEAKFNNEQFGKGVDSTISSLDRLKAGLKLDGATKGMEDVEASASRFSLAGIADTVDGIASHFSSMSMVGITALVNLTNKAIDAGINIAKSLTIEPISAGLQSYNDQINATQVILANTKAAGSTLPDVTKTLGVLQTYANQTVYSFSDMTQNIGRFTAAGVGLQPATDAIKGMANTAALSGASTEQMSGAMYQMSQALASGTVKLQDWNSLANANMAGQNIQEALKQTAKSMDDHGAAMDKAIDKQGTFRDSLSEGWLTTDIYSKAMKVMGGTVDDATGKFRAFSVEELKQMGYSDDAAASLNQLSQDALNSAVQIRTIPQMMDALHEEVATAWGSVFKVVFGDINDATSLFTGLHNFLENLFTAPVYALRDLLQGWADLGGRAQLISGLTSTFKVLSGIVGPIKAAFHDMFPSTTAQGLFDATTAFSNFMQDMIPAPATMKNIERTFAGVFAVLHIGWTIVKDLAKFFFDLFAGVEEGNKGILQTTATIGDFFVGLDKAITAGGGFTKFLDTVRDLLFIIINPIKNLGALIGNAFSGVDISGAGSALGNFISNLLSFGSAVDDTSQKASSGADTIKAIFGGLTGIASNVAKTIGKFASSIANAFSGINFDDVMKGLQTFDFAAVAAGLFSVTKGLKSFNIFGGKSGAGGLIGGIKESLEGLNGTLKSMQNENNASALLKLAGAIALLALAVMLLASIDPVALAAASVAMGILFVELTKGMQQFNKAVGIMGAAKLNLLVPALIGIAIAILLLVIAVKILTALSWEGLAKGLLGLGIMLGMLSASVRVMAANNKRMLSTGLGLLAIAIAVEILVFAVKQFANMDWASMAQGLAGVGLILLELALFTRFAKAGASAVAQGVAIVLLAGAIMVLALAVQQMASMSWSDMVRGLTGTAIGMGLIATTMRLLPKSSLLQALAIAKVASALGTFADVFVGMAKLSWSETIRGMLGFAVTFGMVILAIKAIEKVNFGQLAGLSMVTGALEQMSNALKTLGDMSWDQMIHGLVGLVGTIAVLVIALKALEKIPATAGIALGLVAGSLALLAPALATMAAIPMLGIVGALVLLAGVFVIIGVAANLLAESVPVLIGLGIAIGLLGLAIALAGAGTLAFALGFTMLGAAAAVGTAGIVAALSAIIGLIPMVLEQVGLGLVALANVIATSAPAFIGAMTAVLTALLQSVINILPQLAILIMELITLILAIITNAVPQMIQAGITILFAFLNGINDNIEKVVMLAGQIIIHFLNGLASQIPGIVTAAVSVIVAFVNGISDNIGRVIDAAVNLIISFVNGVADAIRNHSYEMGQAGGNLATAIVEGMVKGISGGVSAVFDAAKNLAKGALDAAKNFLGINSPSKEFHAIGMGINEGMRNGINDYAYMSTQATENMGSSVLDTMGKTISGLGDLIGNGMDDLNPVISPVLDLSSIQRDSAQIGDMLNAAPISLTDVIAKSSDASAGYAANQAALAELASSAGTNVTLNQTNTSPKALSSVEIYRQTNNQLSQLKGALA